MQHFTKTENSSDLQASIEEMKQELEIVDNLKKATTDYLMIEDYLRDDDDSVLCLLLGQLELSSFRRKKMLEAENKI